MGVHGLWKLIESAGKPVPVETLENKVLAVDVSIWLHQLMKGYQTPSGSSVSNAYLLGLFSRVCKLLFTNVKPVFVFDGGVPQLKKKTIAARQQQKSKSAQASEKLRQQLLKNLLKQKAVSQVLEEIRGQSSPKKKERDMFELPPLPEAEDSLSEVEEMSDSSSEEDVKPIKMKFRDLHTIDVKSAEFRDLPADMRHDILTELKETRKQNSWGRIHEMPEELGDFSKYQMSRLLKRRSVQVSLEEAEKEMGGRTLSLNDVEALLAEGGVEINPQLAKRIASDDVTRYIYVRETGEQPNSSQETLENTLSNEKRNSLQGENSSLNPDVKIKEEIIDCDELSDSELIKEVEAIEMAHIVENIKKEENVDFGTEDMFEDDTSSEGVIIDGMDLITDTSGLSQEQILAIIKRENQNKTNVSNEDVPSTSNESNTFQEDILKTIHSKTLGCDDNVILSKENIKDLSETSKSNESKVLESLYFKINKKRLKSSLSEKTKQMISNDNNEASNVKTIVPETNTEINVDKPVKSSDFPLESDNSECETNHNLPCEVSLLEMPKNSSKLVLKLSSQAETAQSKKIEDVPCMSSSESDSEFVEVPSSSDAPGLEIQIQTTQENIHDDIFADIFVNEKTNRANIGNQEITPSITKGFQIEPLPSPVEWSRDAEKKENNQSQAQPTLKIQDQLERIVRNETSCVNINSQKKTNKSVPNLQQLKCAQDLLIKKQTVQKSKKTTQRSLIQKQITTPDLPIKNEVIHGTKKDIQSQQVQKPNTAQANKKRVLDSQKQTKTSLESKEDVKIIPLKPNTFHGNRKYRQSLYTQKQINQTNVQHSQMNIEPPKTKTVQEIFSSVFEDDESDEENVDDPKSLLVNEGSDKKKEFRNDTEMKKATIDNESSSEPDSLESVENSSENTPSPTNDILISNEEVYNHKHNEQSVTLCKRPSALETNTKLQDNMYSSTNQTNQALHANEETSVCKPNEESVTSAVFEKGTVLKEKVSLNLSQTNQISLPNEKTLYHKSNKKSVTSGVNEKSTVLDKKLHSPLSSTHQISFPKEGTSINKQNEESVRLAIKETNSEEKPNSSQSPTNQISFPKEGTSIHKQNEESVRLAINETNSEEKPNSSQSPTNQISFPKEGISIHKQNEESVRLALKETNSVFEEKLNSSKSPTNQIPFPKEGTSIHKQNEESVRLAIKETNSVFEEKLSSSKSPTNQIPFPKEGTSIHKQNEESVGLAINERNAELEERLHSSLSATEGSEDQQNLGQRPEDNEEVDDPGQSDESDDPALRENIDQSRKPKRILDVRQLEKLQDILETKERELVVDHNREDRLATSLTDQMYQEAQELLRLFGVPYIVAPMEAEAQCAFLDASGLTEGTITDDSDIWLFGGHKVYKNFFDQKKFVLEFQSGDIQQYFKLGRSHLVLLALLVGSDYTVGLSGVGPVTALEILSTFPLSRPDSRDTQELLVSLTRFRDWWNARPETHTALAKKLRNVDLHEGFPSSAVVSAYLNPLVDDSREPFTWGTPDVAALRDYAERKFGWSRSRTDQVLLPAVNKLSQRTSQLTLHTFFGAIPNIAGHREQMSRRVQSAVNRLEGGSEEFTPVDPRPRQPRGRGGNRGGRGRGRAAPLVGVEEPLFPGDVSKAPEVIPQREKDKAEAMKRKQQAIEVLKNKKQRGIKKRRNIREMKPEANLSESSSDGN